MLSRQMGLCAVLASVVLLFATPARAELLVPGAATEKRVALVIGNSSYTYASSLAKPRPDAHAIAEMFRTAHFDSVEEYLDLDGRGLERVVREFGDKTRDANVAVVYFSGHGIQLNGSDYLVPVDAQVTKERDVRDKTLPLERILAAVEPAKRLRVVILDACRTGSVQTDKKTAATRPFSDGLAIVRPRLSQTIIVYAAQEGTTTREGIGEHSPFAAALLDNLMTSDIDIRSAFDHVGDQVRRSTSGRQLPFVASSLTAARVELAPSHPVETPTTQTSAVDRDYDRAAQVGTAEAWGSFIANYDGLPQAKFYLDLARASLKKMQKVKEVQRAQTALDVAKKALENDRSGRAAKRNDDITENTKIASRGATPQIPGNLETKARDFVDLYIQRSQGDVNEVTGFTKASYAADVDYYGSKLRNEQVVNEQRAYIKAWPQRIFRLEPNSEKINCNKANSTCKVIGVINFHDENPAKAKKSIGTASFEMLVVFDTSGPKIVFENGEVLSRRN
jgi:hypothetical protein